MLTDQIITLISETNDLNYNYAKSVEELIELAEVLQKRLIKQNTEKNPSDKSIIEEIGDVKIRIMILEKLFGEEKVEERVNYKLNKFKGYIDNKKFVGRI